MPESIFDLLQTANMRGNSNSNRIVLFKKNRERERKGGSEIEKDWMNESRAMTENGGIQASAAVNAYVVHTLNN